MPLIGDTKGPFAALGTKLQLPQTATMAVQAPEPVPYMEECYQWYPSFDFLTGECEYRIIHCTATSMDC